MERVPAGRDRPLVQPQLARVEQAVASRRDSKLCSHSARNSSARYSLHVPGVAGLLRALGREREHVRRRHVGGRRARASGSGRAPPSGSRRARSSGGTRPRRTSPDHDSTRSRSNADSRARVLRAARARTPPGWRPRPVTRAALSRELGGAVALAARHVHHVEPCDALRDPAVDGEVALEPVVLLGDVRQRPLAGERQRRDALRLVLLRVFGFCLQSGGEYSRAPPSDGPRHHRQDPRRQHPLPRPGGRRLRREVGHRLRRGRPGAGDGEAGEGARRRARPLRARARDRRRHRLLHAQSAARRGDRRGRRDRHLAGDARDDVLVRRAARPRRRARSGARPTSCRSPTSRSTSCSATPCCTTCPTSRPRSPSSAAC